MKLGTVLLLALGVVVVNPALRAPALTSYVHGGGPIIPGPVWPWVCLTIACGAISGFHALIGSGTSPKMINNDLDIRPIGYGAMLVEGFVGLLALIAACTLLPEHYLTITAKTGTYAASAESLSHVAQIAREVGEESLVGRQGGSVTLAVGMADVLSRIPGLSRLMAYWYHFATMFEALFILTTIDTGTRVARFILQEMLGRVYKPLGGRWLPGVILTSFLVSFAWWYLVHGGTVSTIWPMFGIANQLLGGIALAIGTTYILRHATRPAYGLVTALPCGFMMVTVFTSGVQFSQRMLLGAQPDYSKGILTVVMMALAAIIVVDSLVKWRRILCKTCDPLPEFEPEGDLLQQVEATEISD
jgi:carbon starvation protein